jgi:3-hydroxyisobutyryl-CoA hydrolase
MSLISRLPSIVSTSADEDVLVSLVGRTMVITLNRPKTLNALTIPMIKRLYAVLKVTFELKFIHSITFNHDLIS